jgi:hypothetical protein
MGKKVGVKEGIGWDDEMEGGGRDRFAFPPNHRKEEGICFVG